MKWDDYQAIGEALSQAFPDTNHLTIKDGDLVGLVTQLPDFADSPTPPDSQTLSAIGFAWIAAAEGPDDAGPFESLA